MWTIRHDQAESLRLHHLRTFEDEMVKHLTKFSPRLTETAGETAVRDTIRSGIESAKKYGFTNRGPVRFYVELMFTLGSYFDTDPQYPWASGLLARGDEMHQSVKADFLYEAFNEFETVVLGPKGNVLNAAAERLQSFGRNIEKLRAISHEDLCRAVRSVYPEKFNYLGLPTVERMVRNGVALARTWRLDGARGELLVVALEFSSGHRFYQDPLWKWMTSVLQSSAEARTNEAYNKGMLHMDQMLAGKA